MFRFMIFLNQVFFSWQIGWKWNISLENLFRKKYNIDSVYKIVIEIIFLEIMHMSYVFTEYVCFVYIDYIAYNIIWLRLHSTQISFFEKKHTGLRRVTSLIHGVYKQISNYASNIRLCFLYSVIISYDWVF